MSELFECEIRYDISDIQQFHDVLTSLGGKQEPLVKEYIDHYWLPKSNPLWDVTRQNMRIREWLAPVSPSQLFYGKIEVKDMDGVQFKRSVFSEGKIALYQGELKTCEQIVRDLNFRPWMVIQKIRSEKWNAKRHNIATAVELIENYGWSGELEFSGENIEETKLEISRILEVLGIKKEAISFEPFSVIYARKNELL